jgi:hypothetical protein
MADAKTIIAGMLKEDTGKHFLDSGFDNGRQWQRNQLREFENEPESVFEVDVSRGYVTIQKSTYHFLNTFFEATAESEKLNREMLAFADLPENSEMAWMEVMVEFFEQRLLPRIQDGGLETYNVSDRGEVTNTYNYESAIDQVLQFILFPWSGDAGRFGGRHTGIPYIILQIHGGADVRGGYTAPHIFAFKAREHDIDDFVLADGDYSVTLGDEQWYTDDHGSHWYFEGSTHRSMKGEEFGFYICKFLGIPEDNAESSIKFPGDLHGTSIDKLAVGRLQKKQVPWDVYLRGRWVDTIFFDDDFDRDRVKKSLVDHDHYDPAIVVTRGRRS